MEQINKVKQCVKTLTHNILYDVNNNYINLYCSNFVVA